MPAVSKAQQRYFGMLHAHPEMAKERGVSAKVAEEFAHAPGGSTKGLPARKQGGARMGMHGMKLHMPMLIIRMVSHPIKRGKQHGAREDGDEGKYDFMRLVL